MNKQQILAYAKQDPKFAQAVLTIEQKLQGQQLPPQELDQLVKLFEMAVNHPDKWPQIREAAIRDGHASPDVLPENPDPVFLMSVLVALYGLQERSRMRHGFANGGLAQAAQNLRSAGRNGDTMLAHINPAEARLLQSVGGSGTINPHTGLPEFGFWDDVGSVLKVVAPIALTVLAPGIGTALGTALGASATWAPIVGGPLLGRASSSLTGGNFAQGALLGGLGGGLGSQVGQMVAPSLEGATQAMIGSGLLGGAYGAATGKGFLQGAAQGAAGQYLGQQVGATGAEGALGAGLTEGGKQFGNMMTAGYSPGQSIAGAGLAGLSAALIPKGLTDRFSKKPSQTVIDNMFDTGTQQSQELFGTGPSETQDWKTFGSGKTNLGAATNASGQVIGDGSAIPDWAMGNYKPVEMATTTPGKGGLGDLFTLENAGLAAILAGSLSSAPQQVQQEVSKMSPAQQEYFNRPSIQWDWSKMQDDASRSGMSLSQYMSQNWNRVTGGQYNQPAPAPSTPPKLAAGGPLNAIAGYARGSGSGRADTIDAKLSDGEYVFDAESVAMLGDGSNEEGARRLDQMRSAIRAHKGKTLAKGKISPDAKSPLAYLKGVA